MELDYAGDLSPKQAWTLLKEDKNCQLIDCRSAAEWSLVGVPELDSLQKSPIFVEWQIFPMMEKNPKFFKEISEKTGVSINTSLGRMRYALINLRNIIKKQNISLTN